MAEDIVERVDKYIADEARWSKLSSTVQYRALEIALLREILVEMRKLTGAWEAFGQDDTDPAPSKSQPKPKRKVG